MDDTRDMTSSTTNVTENHKTEKLKMSEKLTYGIGDFGANFSWTFMASFLTIYLTDIAGIAAATVGTIMFVSHLTDGFSDLFMGTVIDNTNTKMGRAKPWVFWTAPILAVLLFSIFNVPNLGQTAQIIYVFAIYLLITAVFYTANNVAYSSLISFMTNDKEDRVSLGSIRFIFANTAVLIITSATTFIVSGFGGGQQGWTITALIYALLCALPLMAAGWFVKERNVANVNEGNKDGKRTSLKVIFKALLSNKYFLLAILLYVLWYLRQTGNAIRVYYATYVFDNPNTMAIMSVAALLPMILGLMFASKIAGKFGIRRSSISGLSLTAIGYVIMWIFSSNLAGLTVGMVINALGQVPLLAALSAIVADVGDLVYWQSGVPVQGSAFSVTSAGMKIGTGLQGAVVGWALTLGNYDGGAAIQPDSAIFAMETMMIYFPLIIVILLIITVALMNYEKFLPKIREEIDKGNIGKNRDKNLTK